MRRLVVISCVILGWGCAGGAAVTAEEQPAPPAQAKPCQTAEFRQFDFWIGEWDVIVAGDRLAGENLIEPINGGCALKESYTTPGGFRGNSFNIFDAARGVWHQTWVDSTGTLLTIEGGLQGRSMVMTGTQKRKTPQGEVLDRISWTPGEDGSVRQVWEVSADEGASWSVIFDGSYRRKPAATESEAQD